MLLYMKSFMGPTIFVVHICDIVHSFLEEGSIASYNCVGRIKHVLQGLLRHNTFNVKMDLFDYTWFIMRFVMYLHANISATSFSLSHVISPEIPASITQEMVHDEIDHHDAAHLWAITVSIGKDCPCLNLWHMVSMTENILFLVNRETSWLNWLNFLSAQRLLPSYSTALMKSIMSSNLTSCTLLSLFLIPCKNWYFIW